MAWPDQIEQWRQFVAWECKDIPVDLILSIIGHESGGHAGLQAQRTCKPGDLLRWNGTPITVNRALGLMQCIPSVINGYNDAAKDKAFYDDMTSGEERGARLQIRIGSWIYAANVRALYNYDSAAFPGASPGTSGPEQLRLALCAYAIGFGQNSPPGGPGLKPKLDELKARGWPLTLDTLQKAFPTWGKWPDSEIWINRPLQYAQTVWNNFLKHGSNAPGKTEPSNPLGLPDLSSLTKAADKLKDGWPWLIIAAALALLFLKRGARQPRVIDAGAARVIGRA